MRTEFAVFVAEALGKARMGANEPVQRLPDRPGVERQVARATGEAAVGAMQQHPHAGTTIGGCDFRHRPPTLARLGLWRWGDRQELGAPCVWVPSSQPADHVRRRDGYRRVVAFRPAIVNWRT